MLNPALAAVTRAREMMILTRDVAVAVRSEETAEAVQVGVSGSFGDDGTDMGGGGVRRLAGGFCGHCWV